YVVSTRARLVKPLFRRGAYGMLARKDDANHAGTDRQFDRSAVRLSARKLHRSDDALREQLHQARELDRAACRAAAEAARRRRLGVAGRLRPAPEARLVGAVYDDDQAHVLV